MAKVYLSAAAHATDNKTQCPQPCGENTHCNAYMDIVEKRLRECGFEVRRGNKENTGGGALKERVAEANKWKADIYYVAHTNAGGGRYSMTMCYKNNDSKSKANIIHKYRKCVKSHKVVASTDLYEINATAMTCLYDELFFHDNAEDCAWFHNGGMELLAEETVRALCEICGITHKEQVVDNEDKHTENAPVSNNGVNSVMEWQKAAIADGYKFPKYGADGKWGAECESVAKAAICKQRLTYTNKNLTKIVQKKVGATADGLFGQKTKVAVREYQRSNGLTDDGVVGINTWEKILGVK